MTGPSLPGLRWACALNTLNANEPVAVVALGFDRQQRPVEGLVLQDGTGQLRAYLNRCRHLPVPLDASRRFLTDDKTHLRCRTHGARFRISDGMCTLGPCQGLPLWPLETQIHAGQVYIVATALQAILDQLT